MDKIEKNKEEIQNSVRRRRFEGEVVKKSGEKTIGVVVKTKKMHKKYKKQYLSTKKYGVHDEKNEAKSGDVVAFEECRPISKSKRWRLVEIIKKA